LSINNLLFRIGSIQNLIGNNKNSKGLLNILLEQKQEIYLFSYELGSLKNFLNLFQETIKGDTSDLRVIAPLGLDDVQEIYMLFHNELKLPVYPLVNNIVTSKWLINFTFAPHTPRTFYFPENTNALNYIDKIFQIAKRENIAYFILKDEYDLDLRDIIPYSVTPLEKLEHYLAFFYEKSRGISNVGGLVMEEFLSSNDTISLSKYLFYEENILECISNKIKLKPFKNGDFFNAILESSTEANKNNTLPCSTIFNPIIKNFYRYILSSLDFIIYNKNINVIDLNGVASTLNYLQKKDYLNIDNFFKQFITGIISEKNEDSILKQKQYILKLSKLYYNIRKLGPSFTSGERYISLEDLSEKNIKEIIQEYLDFQS
jgi:hypothetical protein